MNGQDFSLQPFSPIGPPLNFKITGHITRRSRQLAIRYDLRGDLAELVIPAPADLPARRHGLWEETCFEFFLGVKDSPRYWEFNLSPAGHWNVYRFAGYRQGMAEETALDVTPRERPAPTRTRCGLLWNWMWEELWRRTNPLRSALRQSLSSRAMG